MPGERFYSTKEWHKTRMKVLFRDKFCCAFCGTNVRGKRKSRVDHILPRKTHPDLALEMSNLRVLCVPCDAMRHSEKGWKRGDGNRDNATVDESGLPTDPNHLWNQQ